MSENSTSLVPIIQRFRAAVRESYQSSRDTLDADLGRPTKPLVPVLLSNMLAPTEDELNQLAEQYYGPSGVANFYAETYPEPATRHPLLNLCEALSTRMPTAFAVDHPMEGHREAVSRFGPPDGTLKIYDLPLPKGGQRYREQAETNESFDAHNDGLGYAGLIATAALFVDSGPALGGYTYFSNMVRNSEALAVSDPEAFATLFEPSAIIARRPRGKGAIEVASPVFYLGPSGDPRCFLRVASGEYEIEWSNVGVAGVRAREWCESLVQPFANGSVFVHFMTPGEGVLIRNQHVVHGRTPFLDGHSRRCLSRKWFVSAPAHQPYRHAPSMVADSAYLQLFPEQFDDARTSGDWSYSQSAGANVLNTQ